MKSTARAHGRQAVNLLLFLLAASLLGGLVLLAACAPTPERPPVTPAPSIPQPPPERCEDCHSAAGWDPDGPGPAPRAPNVMGDGTKAETPAGPYGDGTWGYNINGHGAEEFGKPSRRVGCTDCHALGDHHRDGVLNTLDWPGRDNVQTANTSHLVEGYLPAAVAPGDLQIAFDDYCSTTCHPPAIEMRHSDYEGGRPDKAMVFGEHLTNPDPKKVREGQTLWGAGPYLPPDYGDLERHTPGSGPAEEVDGASAYWFPWTLSDHTTAAAAPPHYGTCASCHDPHGTPTMDRTGNSNHMVRYNWLRPPRTDPGFFCNSQCHKP